MPRIQILELPEGAADERPPFVLVVDQYEPYRYVMGPDQAEPPDPFEGAAQALGARTVLVFAETIDIPAHGLPNDTLAGRIRALHRPVEHRGQTICAECSAYDGQSSTDNAPIAYDDCPTLRILKEAGR